MKKLMLMAAIAVFGLSNVNAQEVTFGVKGGVNFANVGGDDVDDANGLTSFHVGGVVNIGISEKFSIQPELTYSGQGYSFDDEGNVDVKLNYINVPVLVKRMLTEGLSVEVGPQIGFLTSAKADADGDSEDIKDFIKSTDFAAVIGLGYILDSGLNFGARFNLGLSDIFDEGDAKVKNNVFQISVGYMF